ncbi:MAG: hypothetical protein KF784_06870 [Fimbriimonadaceae bacterium]|nr:hypothetical protein [Fimbriimonadaceae bacterium]
MSNILVLYVHGTFAQDLNTEELDAKIISSLKDHNVTHQDFKWPKKILPAFNNTHGRRKAGARELNDYLASVKDKYDAVFLVTHSHGTTVSLIAEKERGTGEPVNGIVSLSTPFIVTAVPESDWFSKLISFTTFLITGLLLFGISWVFLDNVLLSGIIGGLLSVAVPVYCLFDLKRHEADFDFIKIDRKRLFLASSAFDEAGLYTALWAQALKFLSWAGSIYGLLWIGIPVTLFMYIISEMDRAKSIDQLARLNQAAESWLHVSWVIGLVFCIGVVHWLSIWLASMIRPKAKLKTWRKMALVVPVVACVSAIVLRDEATTIREDGIGSAALILLGMGVAALTVLGIFRFFVAFLAQSQLGLGIPFSVLMKRTVSVEKTFSNVPIYTGFSPNNDTPIRHSRLLGWEPCQDAIVEYIVSRVDDYHRSQSKVASAKATEEAKPEFVEVGTFAPEGS